MPGRRDLYDQAMKQGASAAWDQEWDRAIAAYTSAIQEFPDDANALSSLGFAYLQVDRLEDALSIYQRSAALAPGDPLAPEKCGEILERLGRVAEAAQTYMVVAEIHLTRRDVQKAIENWDRVVRLTPDNLMAHSRLALACERTGLTKQAILEYIEVARIFQRARDNDKALQAATRAQQLDATAPEPREALEKLRRNIPLPLPERPRTLTGSLKPLGTEGFAQPAVGARPEPPPTSPPERRSSVMNLAEEQAMAALAEMMFETDVDASKTAASSINSLTHGTGYLRGDANRRGQALQHLGQAIAAQSGNDSKTAISQYESALAIGFESAVVNFMLGKLYLDTNRPADARKRFEHAINHEAVGLGAKFGLGRACVLQNQGKAAVPHLLAVLRELDLALIAPEKQGELSDAYESVFEGFNQAAEAELTKVANGMVEFLSGDGWEQRLEQARQQLDASAESGRVAPLAEILAIPGAEHVVESMRLIDYCISKHLWASALEEAIFALVHSPTHLPIHIRMAEVLVAENKLQAAVDKYIAIAETYRIRGDLARAAQLMQQVLKYNSFDVGLRSRLIGMLVEQGRAEAALEQFMDLADTHYQLADLDAAYQAYGDALALAQQGAHRVWQVKFLHKMADIELQRLNWREAQRLYEQIKTLAPNDETARVTLIDLLFRFSTEKQAVAELDGYVRLLLSAKQGDRAVQMLEDFAQATPDSQIFVGRLAKTYQDLGRKAEAIRQYDQLGELQLQANQNAAARATIQTIISLGPDNLADYQQLLTQIPS